MSSAESSFSGEANDENCSPAPSPQPSTHSAPAAPTPDSAEAKPQQQALTLLQQLHALQTFSACLFTQDIVSEVFIHSIIDHVRFGSSAWPQAVRDSAVAGVCDMFHYCGKRLESLGTMKAVMPGVYSDLQSLADSGTVGDATRAHIREVIELRARGWVPEPAQPTAAAAAKAELEHMHTDSIAPPEISLAPALKAEPGAAEDVTFTSMLGASGVTLAPMPAPAGQQQPGSGQLGGAGSGGFPYLEELDEPAVKMEDMLAAVRGIDA